MIDINAILNLTTLTERFGAAINLAKANLLRHPDEATVKLADVLDELGKVFSFIEEETARYLTLYFLPDHQNYIECRTILLKTESGALAIKGKEDTATKFQTFMTSIFGAGFLFKPQEVQDEPMKTQTKF